MKKKEFEQTTGLKLKKIGDRLVLDGNLNKKTDGLIGYDKLEELPDNLTIAGSLDLRGSKIKSLPKNLIVRWDLIAGYNLETISENLIVGHDLDLKESEVKEIPNNILIGRDLITVNSSVEKIPTNIYIGEHILCYKNQLPKNYEDINAALLFFKDIDYTTEEQSFRRKDLRWYRTSQINKNDKTYLALNSRIVEMVSQETDCIYKVKSLGSEDIYYIIDDGDGFFYGFRDIDALTEKFLESIDKYSYSCKNKRVTLKTKITFYEAIAFVKAFTASPYHGGVKTHLEERMAELGINIKKRKKYTVGEIIDLAKGYYGHARLESYFKYKP